MQPPKTAVTRRRLFANMAGPAALLTAGAPLATSQGSRPKVRMGVVGGGFGLSFHLHEHPNSEVTAIADLRADRRALLLKQNPKAEGYVDFKDLIRDRNVDAVGVFSGVPDHARMAIEAMKAGKHVVCAVPAAITLEECQALIDTVKSTGMT